MAAYRIPLRIVYYYEVDGWIAHCLEFDLVGDGDTKEEAFECLMEAIRLQVAASFELDNLDNLFCPAEGKYLRMWAEGKQIAVADLHIEIEGMDLDRIEEREYAASRD